MALSATSSRLRAPSPVSKLEDPVVCVPTVLSNDYMSSDVVKKAIHVDGVKLTNWGECYDIRYNSNLVSLLPTYPKLIANMNVLIFSGDSDACVPVRPLQPLAHLSFDRAALRRHFPDLTFVSSLFVLLVLLCVVEWLVQLDS